MCSYINRKADLGWTLIKTDTAVEQILDINHRT